KPIRSFRRYDRRERPELFTVLDVAVEPIPDRTPMRRREDAAVAERARTEFARAIHPADDPAGGKVGGDALDEPRLVDVLDGLAVLARHSRELVGVDRRTPERM